MTSIGIVTGNSDNQTAFFILCVDDLIVRSVSDTDPLEHYGHILYVLQKLEGSLNLPNAPSSQHTSKYLIDHIVTPHCRIPDPMKVQAITEFLIVNSQSTV